MVDMAQRMRLIGIEHRSEGGCPPSALGGGPAGASFVRGGAWSRSSSSSTSAASSIVVRRRARRLRRALRHLRRDGKPRGVRAQLPDGPRDDPDDRFNLYDRTPEDHALDEDDEDDGDYDDDDFTGVLILDADEYFAGCDTATLSSTGAGPTMASCEGGSSSCPQILPSGGSHRTM